jgi:hypothetical protein
VFIEHLLAWQATASYDYEMFRESLPEEVRERADELHEARAPLQEDKISVNVESHLARMRYFRVKAQQARIQSLLQDVDAEGNQQAILSLAELERKQLEINQALDRLSRLTIRAGRSPVDQGTIDQDSGRL